MQTQEQQEERAVNYFKTVLPSRHVKSGKSEPNFTHSQSRNFTLLFAIILYHEIQIFAEHYCICPLQLIVESLCGVSMRGQ